VLYQLSYSPINYSRILAKQIELANQKTSLTDIITLMSRYLEFTTAARNPHTRFSRGNPVHNGKLPSRFREVLGVRVDGEPVIFADEKIVDDLHRTIVERQSAERAQGIPFNCVTFAASMQGIMLDGPKDNPFLDVMDEVGVDADDTSIDTPVNLGIRIAKSSHVKYAHTISPAHTPEKAQYLHKLGDEGPICISGLTAALTIFRCNMAHQVKLD